MDQVTLVVVRAIESGAATTKGIVDATGLSRLKVERALNALEKQNLVFRESQGLLGPRHTGDTDRPGVRVLHPLLQGA